MSSDITSKRLYIFDVDWTLTKPKTGGTFRKGADDWQWLPGRRERLKTLQVNGAYLALATNQGGVAFGYMRKSDIITELYKMAYEVGNNIFVSACFTHPKASIEEYRVEGDTRRKPGPGMLTEAMEHFRVSPAETLYVGDMAEDEQAAKNANVDFMVAEDFFKEQA